MPSGAGGRGANATLDCVSLSSCFVLRGTDATVEFQDVVEDEMLKIGADRMGEGEGLKHAIKSAYERLQPSYGHIHGFDSMFVAKFGRHFGGTYLGY